MMAEPFASVETMLSMGALSVLEGRPVTHVEQEDWTPKWPRGASGCRFLKVRSTGPLGIRRYVVKRSSYATDIIRRLTDDRDCRERLVWQLGVLDLLPADVVSPVVCCARDDEGWALLMEDVEESLQRPERWDAHGLRTLSWKNVRVIVDGLASLHARFVDDPIIRDGAIGLCSGYKLFNAFSPQAALRQAASPHSVLTRVRAGWALLDELHMPDLAAAMRNLLSNPGPLVHSMARYPCTLVHGDPRRENLGITDDAAPRLVLIDWQFASAQPPAVDLAWLLSFGWPMEVSREGVIDYYRAQLRGRIGVCFDATEWDPQLRLALLGQYLRAGWHMLYYAYKHENDTIRNQFRSELTWWCRQACLGLELL